MWQVGIDEAGYGPILGPFVMAAIAISRSGTLRPKDPWKLLEKVTDSPPRRRKPVAPERWFYIADSKQVHRGTGRLAALEFHTLPILWPWLDNQRRFVSLLEKLSVSGLPEDMSFACYRVALQLPICHEVNQMAQRAAEWQKRLARAGLQLHPPRIFVLLPATINALMARYRTKAVLPVLGWRELLSAWNGAIAGQNLPESGEVWCDRLGGRRYYAALLCETLSGWQLQHYLETPRQCRYVFMANAEKLPNCSPDAISQTARKPSRQAGLQSERTRHSGQNKPSATHKQQWTVVITPRAETQSFAVALASMISKYIREVFMYHFNAYWQQHVDGLRPSAGYPGDGKRFLREIESARCRLGLAETQLRRCR